MRYECRCRNRGSIYLFVLASSLIITIIGMGSLFAVRVQSRSARTAEAATHVRLCAQSALELGLLMVTQDPNWRTTQANGHWLSGTSLGDATLSLEGIDPLDGDLTDNEYEPQRGALHPPSVPVQPSSRTLAKHVGGNIKTTFGTDAHVGSVVALGTVATRVHTRLTSISLQRLCHPHLSQAPVLLRHAK